MPKTYDEIDQARDQCRESDSLRWKHLQNQFDERINLRAAARQRLAVATDALARAKAIHDMVQGTDSNERHSVDSVPEMLLKNVGEDNEEGQRSPSSVGELAVGLIQNLQVQYD